MDLSRLLPAHVCHRAVVWLSRQPDARTAWANLDDAGDSRLRVLAQCADIVRKHFTLEDLVGEAHG